MHTKLTEIFVPSLDDTAGYTYDSDPLPVSFAEIISFVRIWGSRSQPPPRADSHRGASVWRPRSKPSADQPASVLGHEVDGFGRDLFCGERQVTFVLAVLVVDDDNHAARADFFDRIRDIGEGRLGAHGPNSGKFGVLALSEPPV